MISLDEQIKKDKEVQRPHSRHGKFYLNKYEGYSNRTREFTFKVKVSKIQKNYRQRQHNRFNNQNVIKITQLHWAINREQLQSICQRFGKVKICRIDWDKMGRSNETASVEYFCRQDAQKAQLQLTDYILQGQKIQVQLNSIHSMPAKRHEIHKNYNNRYRGFHHH